MNLLLYTFTVVLGIYICEAGYGTYSEGENAPSDVRAVPYLPPYANNMKHAPTGYPKKYLGTKTNSVNKNKRFRWGIKTGRKTHRFYGRANETNSVRCEIDCKNNGICVDTNTCQCPSNYQGQYCEFEKKPCLVFPPLPMNSDRTCSPDYCTISCMEGFKFIDGTSVTNMRCVSGQWQPTRTDFTSIPDCQPECSPPCLNGGACLSVNTCQCPVDYKGPQCQYAASVCDVRKLGFNGDYSDCMGDNEMFSCKLSCPSGASLDGPAVDRYTCLYSTGVYEPQPIPYCVFNEVIIVTPSNYKNIPHSIYSPNHTDIHQFEHPTEADKYGVKKPITIVVQDFTPKSGSCLTWAGVHYKTFDGKIYSFQSPCQHILVRDSLEHKFTIAVRHPVCERQGYCPSELIVYLQEQMYSFTVADDGSVLFRSSKRLIPVPAALPGIRVSMPSDQLVVSLDLGVTLKWDTNNLVVVEASALLWNKTEGLCGTLDGNPENDMTTKEKTFANTKSVMIASWQLNLIGVNCDSSSPTEISECDSKSDADMIRAFTFCSKIFSLEKFRECSKVMDVSQLLEACQWDYCACLTSLTSEECACRTVSVYAKECLRHGMEEIRNWRDTVTCPMTCPEGKIYKACGSDVQASCLFPEPSNASCVEGCFCPPGLLLEAGNCVKRSECPCHLRNQTFPPGTIMPKSCNTCTCSSGSWSCSEAKCGARCSATGNPHYTSFDGRRYDFMGLCTYTLLKTDELTVEIENVDCPLTEAMNPEPYNKVSCTKSVKLIYNFASVHLKQGGVILVNSKEINSLPITVGDIKIRAASSLFVMIQLPIKVDLWWDGNTRVYVDVPSSFQDKTKGLCGTFNLNQQDDFLTPEGDVEQTALAFANKWKTREFCDDISTEEPEHPCKANIENKDTAEKYCNKLKTSLFESCHWYLDVQPYYEDCLYDMCACAGDVSHCLCPILGSYADACARSGVMVQWRYHVKECELQCMGGQEYTVCADSCLRTCTDVSLGAADCKPQCVEGCACPVGQVLDNNNVCVPIGLCPCYHKGMEFNPGYKEVRAGRRETELCTCLGAHWSCSAAVPGDEERYPPADDLRSACSATDHKEFTTCELTEPLTCKNMHLPPTATTQECRPGCQCKKGYVMDSSTKKCVLTSECPCHHGARSYPDGHTMQEGCNTCECNGGKWSCTSKQCGGVCSVWGDSHVITFDGQLYDFEGVCTYLLAKGTVDGMDGFSVEIQNEPCGTTGATCSKLVTLRVGGSGDDDETVTLTRSAQLPETSKFKRIKLRLAGAYVFLDVPSLGATLQWDRGLRVYVKLNTMWQSRVKGLCGNFNSDMRDDFQTPSGGGLAETSPLLFADSWKLKSNCPKPQEATDHCKERPNKQAWAATTCGALKRFPFSLCHSEVPPSEYMSRCEADACACDSGGDCDCACAALAAYATACTARGVTFKWRSQELCPMQCDEECSNYDACISPCPPETCDNTLEYLQIKATCANETCVEGCKVNDNKKCPVGTVYSNSSLKECVPRAKCKPVCMILLDGREVVEGEVIEEDACHNCRCSKKERVCTGQPCPTDLPGPTGPPETTPHDQPLICRTGWTEWLNRGAPEISSTGASVDNEPLPQINELTIGSPMCKKEKMSQIECRTVGDHRSPKDTGLNVECSLENGLICSEPEKNCPDFEIRVLCECEDQPFQCLDSTHPSRPHPSQCELFFECTPSPSSPGALHAILKSCGAGLLYNPSTMVCDWPASVVLVRPECGNITTTEATTRACPPHHVYKECVFPCEQLCDHFKHALQARGQCWPGQKCADGCVKESVATVECGFGSRWRDRSTCVTLKDCTCDDEGQIIKPGGVVVKGCQKCQCLDNALHCDSSQCVSPKTPTISESSTEYVPTSIPRTISTTVSPPSECSPDRYIDLLWSGEPLPDSSFSASSVANAMFQPQYAILDGHPLDISAGSWNPAHMDKNQYIQVELPQKELIYGIKMQGSPLFDQYVTSYDVMYGDDGNVFSTVNGPDGRQKIFRGPVNNDTPLKQMFEPPIEAKFVRIRPLSWHDEIAVRFELIGCQEVTTTETTTPSTITAATTPKTPITVFITNATTTISTSESISESSTPAYVPTSVPPTTLKTPLIIITTVSPPSECSLDRYVDRLWPGEPLPDSSFSASSVANALFQPQYAILDGHPLDISAGSWSPAHMDKNQYIQVELPQKELIYGIKMQGSPLFDQYVTSYDVMYGDDGNVFSTVNGPDGRQKIFRGPVNNDTPLKQMFEPPIEAKFVRIRPLSWHDEIAVRFELIGCQKVNTTETTTPSTITAATTPKTPITVFITNATTTISTSESISESSTPAYVPTSVPPTTLKTPLIIITTVSPPSECSLDRYVDRLWPGEPLPDSSFSASSVANALFQPQYAILDGHPLDISAGSWSPAHMDKNQYIQVELPQKELIYGIKMQGSPLFDQYVTSYDVMYGDDGNVFSTVNGPDGRQKIFRGPVNNDTPLKQMFEPPIEAKFVRIRPLSWHDEIAVRFELIGCQEVTTTETTTPSTITAATTPKTPITVFITNATTTISTSESISESSTPAYVPTSVPPTTLKTPLIIITTVSPPSECSLDRYVDRLWPGEPLPDSSFSASSVANALFQPQYAILDGHPLDISAGSWSPAHMDKNQYIQVELPQKEPIYGIKMQGSPLFDQYVTSYDVMYGDDGNVFSTVNGPDGRQKIFRGPVNNDTPLTQMLEPPIEAKFVRIRPLSWHDEIAVRFELIGCQEVTSIVSTTSTTTETSATMPPRTIPVTTQSIPTTSEPLQCTEPLGIGAGLPIEMIEVSSNNDARPSLKLTSEGSWSALYSTPGEWIMFNFTSPRNITGIKTKGGDHGWVTAYNVMFTSDLANFNPVVDARGNIKLFPANFDEDTEVLNEIRPPLHAQYVKVLPVKWHNNIEMRVEPIGCFEPYPTPQPPNDKHVPTPCPLCPGVPPAACACANNTHYDGENCVPRDQCPCLDGFIPYPVGASYRGASCAECVCKLGGVPACSPAADCRCQKDLVPILTDSCKCLCEPCAEGTRICPTSKVCLAQDRWCDGLQDCPDDERDCTTREHVTETVVTVVVSTVGFTPPTTEATTVVPTVTTEKPVECPKVECPPGYIVKRILTHPSYSWSSTSASDLPPPRPRYSYQRYYKGGIRGYAKSGFSKTDYSKGGFLNGGLNGSQPPPQNRGFTLVKPALNSSCLSKQPCEQFKCIPMLPPPQGAGSTPAPLVCSTPTCPPTYALKLEKVPSWVDQCPQYACVPPPERLDFCNMTGRTFTTFDGSEYKYDVCFHILARENRLSTWTIFVRRKCRLEGCSNELLVLQDDQFILVKPKLMIEYDNYEYTVEQTSKICFQKNSFDVNRLGNGLSIKSRKYNFTILYSTDGDIKIGVSKKNLGQVDGLCGLFDGVASNDRSLPNGQLASGVEVFGRAWAKPGLPEDACRTRAIPPPEQHRVWKLCEVITEEPISQCAKVINLDKWRSICLEKICKCTELVVNGNKMTEEECRCLLVEKLVAECLAADRNIDVAEWRIKMGCPAECPHPLVHYDCYRRRCEPRCAPTTEAPTGCDTAEGQCFPGCYCPEGTLRKGDACVAPPDCHDCTCTGIGFPAKYTTFEGDDLPFLGNCTYVASRNKQEDGKSRYRIYATNRPCAGVGTCTVAVHLMWGEHVLHVNKDSDTKKLITRVNGTRIFKYPFNIAGASVTLLNGQNVYVKVPELHLELTVLQSQLQFTVSVPSSVYGGRTEGLCGVCAGYQDHLTTSNGTSTEDFELYGKSWQASPEDLILLEVPSQEQCGEIPPPPSCVSPPPESNPCYNLNNNDKFGACHALVVPQSYIEQCESELCDLNSTDACLVLERYAAECRKQGVCLDWRADLCPYPCKAPLVYRKCVDCERTCDNYDELKNDPKLCDKQPVEGCFCPEGKVKVNDTCIEPSKCFSCDTKNEHYVGDEWQEDACTQCGCSMSPEGARVSCRTRSCAAPVCASGTERVLVATMRDACCKEYVCVPKPLDVTCDEPKQMECGFGQVLKLKSKPDGCMEFLCECKPESECEKIPDKSEVEMMEPGMERVVERGGCCPRVELRCRPETCPARPACPALHRAVQTQRFGQCCPTHSCELPKDKCLVTLEWEAAPKGGEKARIIPQAMLKDTDSAWLDGPCRSCRCESTATGPSPQCHVTSCPTLTSTDQFVVEPHPVPFACCPESYHVACRDGDNIYKVGENWASPNDPCESYQCSQVGEGRLEKVTTVQNCNTDCEQGWQYFPAAVGSQCCGRCRPVACVVGGVSRVVGSKWTSTDFCTNYTCADLNGTLQVQSANESCPEPPASERALFVLSEERPPAACCTLMRRTACRSGGHVYQEGKTWQSSDPCKNYTCARDELGVLMRAESLEACHRDCPRGYEYSEPSAEACCGRCVQTHCKLGEEFRTPGTTWKSADNCTTYACENVTGQMLVTSSREMCPDVSACDPKDLINDACCQICKEKPQDLSKCVPVEVSDAESVGMIRVAMGPQGLCVNREPLKGFKECRGSCDSGTLYNNQTGSHDSSCECCQAVRYEPLLVSLQCAGGATRPHRVASPAACACRRCAELVSSPPTKTGYSVAPRADNVMPDIYARL